MGNNNLCINTTNKSLCRCSLSNSLVHSTKNIGYMEK